MIVDSKIDSDTDGPTREERQSQRCRHFIFIIVMEKVYKEFIYLRTNFSNDWFLTGFDIIYCSLCIKFKDLTLSKTTDTFILFNPMYELYIHNASSVN